MKALITGISGFTGRYLAEELARVGYEVFGIAHREPLALLPFVSKNFVCTLSAPERLRQIVKSVKPDVVVHLAAVSFVAHQDVETFYRTNLIGTRHLLESLTIEDVTLRAALFASSANVYGNANSGPIDELSPPNPRNDYAVSKLAMEYLIKLYSSRLPIIISRPFNYTGVGQAEHFLIPKIVAHSRRGAPFIELGNLDVARDFSDVRMVVSCYRKLLESPVAIGGTFNVCSGKVYTLREIISLVNEISGHEMEVRVNPAFVRDNEVKILMGSRARLESAISQIADIPFEETLRWMLESV